MRSIRRTLLLTAGALVLGVGATLGTTAAASAAVGDVTITAPNAGTGSVIARCNTIDHSLEIHVDQVQAPGPLGLAMSNQSYVYSYTTGKWYGPWNEKGTAEIMLSGIPGRALVYTYFSWYTGSAWTKPVGVYAAYFQTTMSSYRDTASSTCYL